jgi:hypothetical protein
MATEIHPVDTDGRERATVAIVGDALDGGRAAQRARQHGLRSDRITFHADTAAATVAAHLGRVDAEQTNAFPAAAKGVAVNGEEGAGKRGEDQRICLASRSLLTVNNRIRCTFCFRDRSISTAFDFAEDDQWSYPIR